MYGGKEKDAEGTFVLFFSIAVADSHKNKSTPDSAPFFALYLRNLLTRGRFASLTGQPSILRMDLMLTTSLPTSSKQIPSSRT